MESAEGVHVSQINDNPAKIMFPCGCVAENIIASPIERHHTWGCGKYSVRAQIYVELINSENNSIREELRRFEFLLRNEAHVRPWVRRIRSLMDVALNPR